ncbi:ABC transporter substrate-binding protein [Flavimaricola marinus]|uniref:Putative thiamine biosynthesis protein n=1 Tax=Flavimaricola marinus TaxID=1819565 RepID=A0A238LDR4_9RHOB|nr:ABC transporter substrate-binding protein [Flavimaricola marinus]SMY07683.1 Putative thiamine biosynthesis protein [Flavimaricola marinus]
MKYATFGAITAVMASALPATAQDLTEITVLTPLPRHTAWYPLIVGEALGYFAEEGVSVTLVDGGDLPATAFLENGQVDMASLDPSEVVIASVRGFDFDVVYEVMHGAVEGIFVLEDNPATSLSDLGGTTIGIVGESDRGLLLAALGHAGLSEDDVTIAVLGESAPLLANSLSTGQVSGLVGAISDFVAITSQGITTKNLLPPEMSESPANNFAVRADAVGGDRDEVIQGFLRAWAKSGYAGLVDLDATRAMAMEADPENWINEELGTIFLTAAQDLHRPDGEVFGDLRTDIWTGVIAEMAAVGMIDEPIDPSEVLNRAYIDGANDFDGAEIEAEVAEWKAANM